MHRVNSAARLTYIGHATVLIEMDGVRVLTDPLLRDRLMHLRRRSWIDARAYQHVDAVLISHLDWDHFDLPSLKLLGRATHFIVPRGAGQYLRRLGFARVDEIGIGESLQLASLRVEATRARHTSMRPVWGPRVACLGYVLHGSRQVYFAGDTDLFPEMAAIGSKLDAALLPVWGWGPTLGAGHLDPLRAAQALTLLRPRMAIPIHWGTFSPLGMGWARPAFLTHPPHVFAHHAARLAPDVAVHVATPGQPIRLRA